MPSLYIAGKIRKDRHLRQVVDYSVPDVESYKKQQPIRIDNFFTYTGPFVIGCDHGCFHGENSHGAGISAPTTCMDDDITKDIVFEQCTKQIRMSDLFLAWIDAPDCYGTIAELGYANHIPQNTFIAFDKTRCRFFYDDFWFVRKFGTDLGMCTDIKQALNKIKNVLRFQ